MTTGDLARFLVEYAQSDLLGQIANAHLATADESPLVRACFGGASRSAACALHGSLHACG